MFDVYGHRHLKTRLLVGDSFRNDPLIFFLSSGRFVTAGFIFHISHENMEINLDD